MTTQTLRRTEAAKTDESYRPPYLAAAITTLAVWGLYALTLAPTTWFWDTSEYIATAHILGIPHPPGNPLFVVLARAWDLLLAPFPLTTAVRINLFSATMSALAHGCWFLVMHRVAAYYSRNRVFQLVAASCAVLVSATAFTVWNQSNVNEKVYTVSLFTIALLSWLAFRWRDHVGEGKDDNLIVLMVFILALSVGNHLMAFLAAPALFVFILLVHPRTLTNWRLYAAGALAIVLGLSIHLFLPIRSGLGPIINEAAPTCPSFGSALQSVLTMGRSGCENLSEALARTQYSKPSMFVNPVLSTPQQPIPRDAGMLAAQIANYFQYFDWQWARSLGGPQTWFGGLRPLVTLIFAALGLYGCVTHYRHDKKSWAYLFVLFLTLSMGLTFYLNFKYGYTYPSQLVSAEMREVRERDYFFIISFSVWGLWAGLGIAALWRAGGESLQKTSRADETLPPLAAAPVLLLALAPLLLNWSYASRRGDYTARDWAYNLLNSVEPYGVLFTNGDNDTFPLWYVQEVEGIRRDVTVIVNSYLNTNWYGKQLRDLTAPCGPGQNPADDWTVIICQRPYDAETGPAIYDTIATRQAAPTRSILEGFSDAQIDQFAQTFQDVPRDTPIQIGNIQTVIPAQPFGLLPADLFTLAIIRNSLGDRPVYFATTTQSYEQLGLRPYLIRQGFALKLNNGPIQPNPATGLVPVDPASIGAGLSGAYIDTRRSTFLADSVFMHRGGFPTEWSRWVDIATTNIPLYYYIDYGVTAEALQAIGDTAKANEFVERARSFQHLLPRTR